MNQTFNTGGDKSESNINSTLTELQPLNKVLSQLHSIKENYLHLDVKCIYI